MNISGPSARCLQHNKEMSCQNKGLDFTIKVHILQQQTSFGVGRDTNLEVGCRLLTAVARVQYRLVQVGSVVCIMVQGQA
jgi:hypothetical protein